MKVRKAVIPAAGFGTRVLPISKSIPKEMINIVDRPAIQYIVEEAVASGITEILIITSRNKDVIEDYFDYAPELESRLQDKPRRLKCVRETAELANIYFVRQKEMKGLGHAVLMAKEFIGNEPFAVMYGDDVITGDYPVTKQLMEAHEEYGLGTVGVQEVPTAEILKYSSLKVEKSDSNIMRCTDIVEKPTLEEVMSNYAILGRCILPPEIFSLLENTGTGAGGEIQLTDAIAQLAKTKGITAVDFEGKRYDIGNKLDILKANVEMALKHDELKGEFKEYLKSLTKEINND